MSKHSLGDTLMDKRRNENNLKVGILQLSAVLYAPCLVKPDRRKKVEEGSDYRIRDLVVELLQSPMTRVRNGPWLI